MDINATIIGQFITFAILIWFTMKYVWPPITKAMQDREAKIAAGLEAAARSQRELEMAEVQAKSIIKQARVEASHIIEQANLHTAKLVEAAKAQAKVEGARLIALAQSDAQLEITKIKETLKHQLGLLAVAGAEKIIRRNLDPAMQSDLLNQLTEEI